MKTPSSKQIDGAMIRLFTFYSFICAYPYQWNWGDVEHVKLLQNKFKLYIFYFFSAKTWLYWPFLVITLHLNWDTYIEEQRIVHLIVHCGVAAVYGTCISGHYFNTFRKKESVELVNKTIAFNKNVEETFRCDVFSRSTYLRHFMMVMQGLYCFGEMFMSPFFFFTWYKQIFYIQYWILPDCIKQVLEEHKGLLIIVALFVIWFEAVQWGNGGAMVYYTLIYLQSAEACYKFLGTILSKKPHSTSQHIKVMRIYSQTRILNTMYNDMTQIGWPFCNALECLLFIGGFCASMIRGSGTNVIVIMVGIFFMVLSLTILLTSTIIFAKIHTSSEALYNKVILYRPFDRLGRILCKAYKVCGVEFGMFFVVTRHSLFTVMGGLSNAAVSAVLYIN